MNDQAPVKIRPSKWWIVAGSLIMFFGVTIAAAVVVGSVVSQISTAFELIDELERVEAPGTGAVQLEAGENIVYYETESSMFVEPTADVTITAPDGSELTLGSSFINYTYSFEGRSGRSAFSIDAPVDGTYEVEVDTDDPDLLAVAVGPAIFENFSGGSILGAVILGLASFVIGLVMILVPVVKRSGNRKKMRPPPAPWGGAGAGGGWQPPGPWQPPPGTGYPPP